SLRSVQSRLLRPGDYKSHFISRQKFSDFRGTGAIRNTHDSVFQVGAPHQVREPHGLVVNGHLSGPQALSRINEGCRAPHSTDRLSALRRREGKICPERGAFARQPGRGVVDLPRSKRSDCSGQKSAHLRMAPPASAEDLSQTRRGGCSERKNQTRKRKHITRNRWIRSHQCDSCQTPCPGENARSKTEESQEKGHQKSNLEPSHPH